MVAVGHEDARRADAGGREQFVQDGAGQRDGVHEKEPAVGERQRAGVEIDLAGGVEGFPAGEAPRPGTAGAGEGLEFGGGAHPGKIRGPA